MLHLTYSLFLILLNGKKVELAIKNIIDGNDIENVESISNPDCLDEYYEKIKS